MVFRSRKNPRPRVGLALSGGSTWGIAHVGVLKALTEENIPIDYLAGTSAGALVAACHAFGMPVEAMIEATGNVNWKKLSRFGYSRLGLRSNAPMQEFVTDLLGDVQIEGAAIPLAIVATDIQTREKIVLRKGSLHQAIRASTAIPGFFTPVSLEGRMLVDGAMVENIPVPTVRDMGAQVVIGVNLVGLASIRRPKSVLGILFSSFSALSYHRDHSLALSADVLIEPDLSAFDASKFKDADAILEQGYAAAKSAMPLIREKLGMQAVQKRGIASYISRFFTKAS